MGEVGKDDTNVTHWWLYGTGRASAATGVTTVVYHFEPQMAVLFRPNSHVKIVLCEILALFLDLGTLTICHYTSGIMDKASIS